MKRIIEILIIAGLLFCLGCISEKREVLIERTSITERQETIVVPMEESPGLPINERSI